MIGKKEKKVTVTFKLPRALDNALENLSKETDRSKSEIVEIALIEIMKESIDKES
jgi:predicted transcriptional regulator